MLKIGSVIDGRYKILSRIAQGGMSVVYMAINERVNKTWAIKEIRKDGIIDFESVKLGLIVETNLLKRLGHANLPSVVDVIENEESFLIIMDYIEGHSLSNVLAREGAQPQDNVIDWAKQLCDVLGYLHTRTPAIIYRDMKPSNIMLKPNGKLILIDFGIAREFKERQTADTTCFGTVGYAAPEQFGGMGQTDARTDIYCLGATLYHLITGCNPCEPPYELMPIRSINPALSMGIEKIILKCVEQDPKNRYQSCAELMYALDHYEEIEDKHRKSKKKKLLAFLTPTIVSILLLGGVFFDFFVDNIKLVRLICLVTGGILLAISVFLFNHYKIATIISDISGRTRRRAIKNIKYSEKDYDNPYYRYIQGVEEKKFERITPSGRIIYSYAGVEDNITVKLSKREITVEYELHFSDTNEIIS